MNFTATHSYTRMPYYFIFSKLEYVGRHPLFAWVVRNYISIILMEAFSSLGLHRIQVCMAHLLTHCSFESEECATA